MAKVRSKYIKFKKGIQFNFEFYSYGENAAMTAKFKASGDDLPQDILIMEIDVHQDFAIDFYRDYLTVKDFPDILNRIYIEEDSAKSVIADLVSNKIDKEENRWIIYIDPHILPNATIPDRYLLEYELKIHTPKRKFDLDDIGQTDDDIRIPSSIMDQFIESFNKKKLDAAFYDKYMDDII